MKEMKTKDKFKKITSMIAVLDKKLDIVEAERKTYLNTV